MTKERGHRKSLVGRVVSDRMNKTIVVEVEQLVRHPKYGKMFRQRTKFKAHDEGNQCRIGDLVAIMETRPLSREKRWRVIEILERVE